MKKLVSAVCGLGMVTGMGLASPAVAAGSDAQDYTYDLVTMTTDDPRALAVMAELDERVPDWRDQVASARVANPGEQPVLDAVNRAINPDDYECGATPLDAYVDEIIGDVDFFTARWSSTWTAPLGSTRSSTACPSRTPSRWPS